MIKTALFYIRIVVLIYAFYVFIIFKLHLPKELLQVGLSVSILILILLINRKRILVFFHRLLKHDH